MAPRLTAPGLVLRGMTIDDVDEWLAGEDDEQVRWFEFPRPSVRDDVVRAVATWSAGWANGGPVRQWVVCEAGTGTIVGGVDLRDLGDGALNLAYVIFPQFRRRGIATRASLAVIEHARTELDARRIILRILEGNDASLGVTRALRATEVGREPSHAGATFRVFELRVARASDDGEMQRRGHVTSGIGAHARRRSDDEVQTGSRLL